MEPNGDSSMEDDTCRSSKQDADHIPAPETLDIHPHGDIVFVAGPDEHQLRVHSFFLKAASPVFAVMFGPSFSEGQDLDISGGIPKIVKLPDDDSFALIQLCAVIHHRKDLISTPLPRQVLDISILAEKYDCIDGVSFAAYYWLHRKLPSDLQNLGYLMVSAYLFNDEAVFNKVTRNMICNHVDSFAGVATDLIDHVPGDIFCRLYDKRISLLQNFLQFLTKSTTRQCRSPKCDWSLTVLAPIQEELQGLGIFLPGPDTTLSYIIMQMRKIRQNPEPESCKKYHSFSYPSCVESTINSLNQGGLCLACIKSGKTCAVHSPPLTLTLFGR